MPKIDFSRIDEMVNSSLDFSLTEHQYQKLTGKALPKDTYYLTHKSALSRYAEQKGLKIVVHEKTISFQK